MANVLATFAQFAQPWHALAEIVRRASGGTLELAERGAAEGPRMAA
jgi:hypothetical protein